MEFSSRKRRGGLIKGSKLVKSLYRSAAAPNNKPSSSAMQYVSSSNRMPTYPSDGFVINQLMDYPSTIHHLHQHHMHDHDQPKQKQLVPYNPNITAASSFSSITPLDFILDQDHVISSPQKPKVLSCIKPETTADQNSSCTTTIATYNYAQLDSESIVDLKASNYISSVQERFRLEHLNSEMKAQLPHPHQEVLQLQL